MAKTMNAKQIVNRLLEDYDPDLDEVSPESVSTAASTLDPLVALHFVYLAFEDIDKGTRTEAVDQKTSAWASRVTRTAQDYGFTYDFDSDDTPGSAKFETYSGDSYQLNVWMDWEDNDVVDTIEAFDNQTDDDIPEDVFADLRRQAIEMIKAVEPILREAPTEANAYIVNYSE